MDFVNAIVRRSTGAIQRGLREAKTESERKIHLVEDKLEVASCDLSEAIRERDGSKGRRELHLAHPPLGSAPNP